MTAARPTGSGKGAAPNDPLPQPRLLGRPGVSRRGVLAGGAAVAGLGVLGLTRPQQAATGSAAATSPASRDEVWFNDPETAPMAILGRLIDKIDSTPAGATIRAAAYSCALPSVVAALDRAWLRGVTLALCLDDHNLRYAPTRYWATRANSFPDATRVVFTDRSARGPRGVMHAKFWLFSHDRTVVAGSSNATGASAHRQWSSMLHLSEHPDLYDWVGHIHDQMMADDEQSRLGQAATLGPIDVRTCPLPDTTATTDPVIATLDRLQALHHPTGNAPLSGLRIHAAQHGFNGYRAVWVAERLAAMATAGADVQVICGIGTGRQVPGILRRGGCQIRLGERGRVHIHYKHFAGSWIDEGGIRRMMTSDGSENCSDQSLLNDELQLTLWRHPRLAAAWWQQFDKIWKWSVPL